MINTSWESLPHNTVRFSARRVEIKIQLYLTSGLEDYKRNKQKKVQYSQLIFFDHKWPHVRISPWKRFRIEDTFLLGTDTFLLWPDRKRPDINLFSGWPDFGRILPDRNIQNRVILLSQGNKKRKFEAARNCRKIKLILDCGFLSIIILKAMRTQ